MYSLPAEAVDSPGLSIQVVNFSWVEFPLKRGGPPIRRLRFTLVMAAEVLGLGQTMTIGLDGCVAFINSEGKLQWSPPAANVGKSYLKIAWVNEPLDELVLANLAQSKYIADLKMETWDKQGKILDQEVITCL